MEQRWPLMGGKRIIAVCGHYGSGKTELAVSLALLAAREKPFPRAALIDLDIANPYFRSREQRRLLEESGVSVYGSAYREEITAELPALGAGARAPLEDESCLCIVDLGGNGEGAKVIRQFGRYFQEGGFEALAVVNANRPETATLEGTLEHLSALESAMGFHLTGIANNCHLLMETTAQTVLKGRRLCQKASGAADLPVLLDCYPAPLVSRQALEAIGFGDTLLALGMHMRPSWLDK
ncbi:MAG: ATP-binding protein [Clostridia bacterium]|nr:ATP-binding protein [Clostridia bacterium]